MTASSGAQAAGAGHRPVLRRFGRNIAWLLGGRGVAGVLSLVYLAAAARALGPERFGVFSLVLAYGGALAALAQVQSGQAVIRFGALHLAAGRQDRLARLLGSLALLDWAFALIGAALAFALVPWVAPLFGWTGEQQYGARLFSVILLLSTGGTPGGMLRLFDRFDLLSYAETVGPAVRLVGAVALSIAGAGLNDFLLVWALAVAAEAAASWIAALGMRRCTLTFGRRAVKTAWQENTRIGAFLTHSSLSGTLTLVWTYAGTFSVGGLVGPAAAGGFRLAGKLASAVGKPIEAATRALTPEMARLVADDDRPTLAAVTRRVTAAAILLDLVLIAFVALAGGDAVHLLYGRAFAFAGPIFLLLTIATAIDLAGVALEPVLNAYGHAGRMLTARVIGVVGQLAALALLVPTWGVTGAGLAAIIGATLMRGTMAAMAIRLLRRR